MNIFKVTPGSFKELKGKLILRLAITYLLLTGCLFWIFGGFEKISEQYIFLPVIVFSIVLGFRNINRQQRIFESYRLQVDEQHIRRTQDHTPDQELLISAIKSIKKYENGVIVIEASGLKEAIIVPAQLQDLSQLEVLLSAILPVESAKSNKVVPYLSYLAILFSALCMGIIFNADNKWLLGIFGISFVCLLIVSLFLIQRSKQVETRMKKWSWLMLLPLFSITAIVYIKLMR